MDFLEINQRIRIIAGDFEDIVFGIILKLDSDGFAVSLNENDKVKILNNTIEMMAVSKNSLIKFSADIAKVHDNLVYFHIPQDYQLIQRREYTRINTDIPVQIIEIDNPQSCFMTSIINLGGGGMKFVSGKNYEPGTLLKAIFSIFPDHNIETVFEVRRTEEYIYDKNKYILSGIFQKIPNIDKIAIIQLCFKKQLEHRCKI